MPANGLTLPGLCLSVFAYHFWAPGITKPEKTASKPGYYDRQNSVEHCTVFVCLGSEREPRLHWSVGCGRLQPGARCTLETPAGLVGQMHGKYWTTLPLPPLAKISPLAQSLAAPQKNAFPCAEAREEGGRDHGFPSLSVQMRCCRVISVSFR